MVELPRAIRRAFLGIVLTAVAQLLYGGIDLFGIRSEFSRAAQIVLALLLLAGIVPGSYLAKPIQRFSERASKVSRWRGTLSAIGAPLGILALYAFFATSDLASLSRIDNEGTRIRLWFSLAIVLIQLAILVLNLLDLARSSSRRSGA
jgi:hypothetical protein